MKKFLFGFVKVLLGLIILIVAVYLLGPKAAIPQVNFKAISANPNLIELEKEINDSEKLHLNLRNDNEARIVWANDTLKKKTPFSLVYLHGFSASQGEGGPMHEDFAKRYGCNLFLARLYGHGLNEEEALLDWTAEKFIESTKKAIAIGEQLGEKVIVMGTSTGCTAALLLASENPKIHSLINYSPNIDIANKDAWLLTQQWGLQLGRLVNGSNYNSWVPNEGTDNLVTYKYRLEAAIALKALLDAEMTEENFNKITQPLFLGYWYKNEKIQDDVVSVSRMLEMYQQLGTPEAKKRKIAFDNATNHVLASPLWNEDFETVKKETYNFAEEILGLVPIEKKERILELKAIE
ncbi:MAG: alpha/beta hydrolase [Saprospiraceae bacterium]